jgi:AraC-like DNA-binding protein
MLEPRFAHVTSYPNVGATVTQTDSPLGKWISARWSPQIGSRLWSFVDAIWYFHGSTAYSRERAFPDGTAEIIVQLDDVYLDGDNGSAPFPALCVNGLRTKPSVVQAPGTVCRVLGIRFTPIGACVILGQPIRELVDITVDLRACINDLADVLAVRCDEATSPRMSAARGASVAVDAAAWWSEARLHEARLPDPVVRWTAAQICDASGVLSVEALRSQTSLTRSQFAQRFRHALGITPKRYARLLRFHRALGHLATGQDLSRVAHELNYFDQSHMYRDFHEFAEMTPSAYLAAQRYPGSIHLAEP